MDDLSVRIGDPGWNSLYRIGGVAPLITLVIYIGQLLVILMAGIAYPATPEAWLLLFQRSRFLGLIYLNAFDVFSIAILGLMFLALCIALRQINPAYVTVAAFFAFLGVATFVSTRAYMVSATLNLADQYVVAISAGQKSQILTAWGAITAPARATPETTGFLFIAVAGLVISVVMLQSEVFSKFIAYIGILACAATVANDISLVLAPLVAPILMAINGLLWAIWWILVSRRLLQLGRKKGA